MKHRLVLTAGTTALACSLSFAGVSGAAGHGPGAHGHGKPAPTVMTGTSTCAVNNLRLTFSVPLNATPTAADATATLSGDILRKCDNAVQGKAHVRNGHLRALVGTVLAGTTCAGLLSGGALPAMAGGSVRFTPVGHVAASTAISFPAWTLTVNGAGQLALSCSAGTVAGSYATSAVTLSGTSRHSATDLAAACATGLRSIGFTGTASH